MTQPGPGLQAERTALAWTRTSLGVLVNGVLLIVKQPHYNVGPLRPIAAGFAVIIAVVIYVVGQRRQRTLAQRPLPNRVTARADVQLVGVAVLALIIITAGGLFV
ncbi:MAG: hypothetical protein QOC62_4943 [Mycobacterium sp.]|nr:hypothetical protein [Mycobacterium sp.]